MARSRRDLVDLVLKRPEDFPDEFKAWIPRFLADNILFNVSRQQVASVDGESWHNVADVGEPPFENGWVNYVAGYNPAGFYRDFLDIVHVRGWVKSGTTTADTTIFTLPAGYRPENRTGGATDSNGAHGRWEIDTGGRVKIMVGSAAWFVLDGIHFRAFS